jgi:transcriptional regulator with XRE-family HTH domain
VHFQIVRECQPHAFCRTFSGACDTLKRAGLTQEEFAERAGFSYKYYQQIEAGKKRDLRLSTLEKLAKAHRIELSELLRR